MLRARLLRGFRMLRRFRYALLVSLCIGFLVEGASAMTWYCKDAACRSPVAEGTAGYNYNPSKQVVSHGYIPVTVGDNIIAYKQSNRPSVLEVEVKGQRGYVPRTLFDASTSYIGENETLVTMEGPNVLPEEEILAMESLQNQKTEPHALSTETSTASNAQDYKTTAAPSGILSGESEPPKTDTLPVDHVQESVTAPSRSATLLSTIVPGGIVDKKADERTMAADRSEATGALVGDSEQNVVADTSSEPGRVTGLPSAGAAAESTAAIPSAPASPDNTPSTSTTARPVSGDVLATNPAVDPLTAKPSELSTAKNAESTPVKTATLPEEKDTELDENVVDLGEQKDTESSLPPKPADTEASPPSAARADVFDKKEPSLTKEQTLPFAPSQPNLGQLAGELSGSKAEVPATAAKVEPTPQLNIPSTETTTPSPQAVSHPSIEIKPTASGLESTTVSPVKNDLPEPRPEPKVTHGDPNGDKSGFPAYQTFNPLPVFRTKGFDRHRHHNHNHNHNHNHGAHSHHDLSHGGHSHGHAHAHSQDHSGHDHDHSHDHSREEVYRPEEAPVTTTPSPVQEAHVPKRTPAKISPPETELKDEAQSPALAEEKDLELTVDASMDGTNMNEVAVMNASETGQLDPSTATEAPKIPMVENFENNRITANSEDQKAIDNSERYNRPRPDRQNSQDRLGINAQESHTHHHDDHDHDHSHHDHDHSHEEGLEGSCSAKGGESCEQLTHVTDQVPSPGLLAHNISASSGFAHLVMDKFLHGWLYAVTEFETLSGGLRLGGMLVFAALAVISMMSAAADRGVRKAMEKGFEEYDYKKETEMLALREQVKVLLKENEEHAKNGGKNSPVAPPPYMPPTVPMPMFGPTHGSHIVGLPPAGMNPTVGPCTKCAELQHLLQNMRGQLDSNEKVLRDQRETYASILTKNNEVTTELTLITNDRDVTKRSLEDTAQRLVDTERKLNQKNAEAARNMNGVSSHTDSEAVQEVGRLRQRISQLESECESLRKSGSQNNGVSHEDRSRADSLQRQINEAASKVAQLQSERDEATSNVRLLRQLLAEKEEEIRKMRATEAAGGVSTSRELQEKTDDLRNARKQVSRLQDELESVKRDRETQIQIRCQTFRAAADKSQRDALMARQEAWAVQQQLEEVCKRHGENVPPITNGTMTPPGMMATSPMMFSGVGFPPGPPPPSLEAFKQQVLAQQQEPRSSGHSSPRSPDVEHDRARDRRKERKTVKKSRTLDFPANGKDGEDHDDSEGKRDRTYR